MAGVSGLVHFVLRGGVTSARPLVAVFKIIVKLSLFKFVNIVFKPLLLSVFVLYIGVFGARCLGWSLCV